MIGPENEQGAESFDIMICSVAMLASELEVQRIKSGTQILFVRQYDQDVLVRYLEKQIRRVEGATWCEIADKLSWLGHWEFENYKGYVDP
jgi:hypothetical protein